MCMCYYFGLCDVHGQTQAPYLYPSAFPNNFSYAHCYFFKNERLQIWQKQLFKFHFLKKSMP